MLQESVCLCRQGLKITEKELACLGKKWSVDASECSWHRVPVCASASYLGVITAKSVAEAGDHFRGTVSRCNRVCVQFRQRIAGSAGE